MYIGTDYLYFPSCQIQHSESLTVCAFVEAHVSIFKLTVATRVTVRTLPPFVEPGSREYKHEPKIVRLEASQST
jgi:hypothetical protein